MPLIITYAGPEGDARLSPVLIEDQLIEDWAADWSEKTGITEYQVINSEDIPPDLPTAADVNIERDRRLAGTFVFNGKAYDCGAVSLGRITGAATLAGFAIGAGAAVGDLFWNGDSVNTFAWIAADNTLVEMDAQTCFAFGYAAARNQSEHIFAARGLKDLPVIPLDYRDDIWWP